MLNKSEKSKLKSTARKLADSQNINYEEALDHVAREKGYLDWKNLNDGPKKVNFEAYITYGTEYIEKSASLSLNQTEAINLIKCCESYIEVYSSLIEKNHEYIDKITDQKNLTEQILEKIISLANDKIKNKKESSIDIILSGFELGQFITLLFDYGKSIEEYLSKINDTEENKQDRFYLIQIGGIFGDMISKITTELKDSKS